MNSAVRETLSGLSQLVNQPRRPCTRSWPSGTRHARAGVDDNALMVTATVKSWSDQEGWGVLVSPEIREDIWAHFSAIDGPGYRELMAGQTVMCNVEDLGGPVQDGYRFRASRIVPAR